MAEAASGFAQVASIWPSEPAVPAIATFYEARALEADGRLDEARRTYRIVDARWPGSDRNGDEPSWTGLDWPVEAGWEATASVQWPERIQRAAVAARIAALDAATASAPEGLLLARARWLIEHARQTEAIAVLAPLRETMSADVSIVRHEAELAVARQRLVGGRSSRDAMLSR